MWYTPYFFRIISINFNSLAPAKKKNISPIYVLVGMCHSHPHLHFLSNLVNAPKLFPMEGILEDSTDVEITVRKHVGCMVHWEEQSI